VEPNDSSALKSVARLHFRQQNYADAAKYFQRAATLIPEDAGLQNDLGLTLSKLGQSETAIEHLSKALELSPGNSRYSNNLASVLFDNQEEQAALNILSKNNQPAVAHFNMAYLYLQSGKLVQARKHLSEVMKYEVLAADDVATRRAVDRTREMLAGLDLRDESGPVARTAARPISQVMDKSSSTDGVLSATVPASELNNSSSNVPFALPTGYEINPADSGK
jgi:tetratricopeptide (TPR) repeat protein